MWAKFESFSDAADAADAVTSDPALLLVLGYANGAQVWAIDASGEASELFSLRNEPIKVWGR